MSAPLESEFALGVAILGAGASSRMGQPKLLLPWGATSVLGHLIAAWQRLRARQVAVVCALSDPLVQKELDRLGFPFRDRIFNADPEGGMMSSVRCAAGWTGWHLTLTHWAIALGDQPHLRLETLGGLVDFARANAEKICQPGRVGRPRHPVILPAKLFRRLAVAPEENLKQFLQARGESRVCCQLDDPGLDFDIDEPADYERARALAFPQQEQAAV
jgi:molybdenum cofactor cytidylyltransferase